MTLPGSLSASTWCDPGPPEPPPQNSPPPIIPNLMSKLCSYGWRRLMLTGLLRDCIIRHFAQAVQIEEPLLRQYLWRDDERTGILVESIFRWRGELVEKRPAVIIKPTAMQMMRLGLRNLSGEDGQ